MNDFLLCSDLDYKVLADKFGVAYSTIHKVKRRETWAHI